VEGYDVGVLTKSDLVVRDVDVLRRIESVDVGFTVTTLEPDVASIVESGAPSPARRLAAMRELSDAGMDVWGFFGPVLPGVSDSEEAVSEMLEVLRRAGASRVLVDRLNLYPKVLARLRPAVEQSVPKLAKALVEVKRDPDHYERALRARVHSAARGAGIEAETCF
jgi:DNA repair photolyase